MTFIFIYSANDARKVGSHYTSRKGRVGKRNKKERRRSPACGQRSLSCNIVQRRQKNKTHLGNKTRVCIYVYEKPPEEEKKTK